MSPWKFDESIAVAEAYHHPDTEQRKVWCTPVAVADRIKGWEIWGVFFNEVVLPKVILKFIINNEWHLPSKYAYQTNDGQTKQIITQFVIPCGTGFFCIFLQEQYFQWLRSTQQEEKAAELLERERRYPEARAPWERNCSMTPFCFELGSTGWWWKRNRFRGYRFIYYIFFIYNTNIIKILHVLHIQCIHSRQHFPSRVYD